MESFKTLAQELLNEITGMLSIVEASTFNALVNGLLAARHVSVAGDGRARYVAAAFVRRLTVLGRSASLVGV